MSAWRLSKAFDSSSATRLTMLCGIKTAARRRTKVTTPRIVNTLERRFVVLAFKASCFCASRCPPTGSGYHFVLYSETGPRFKCILEVNSFHEKAGECQVCFSFFLVRMFLDLSPILRQRVKRQYSANGGRHGVVSKEVHTGVQVGGVGARRARRLWRPWPRALEVNPNLLQRWRQEFQRFAGQRLSRQGAGTR